MDSLVVSGDLMSNLVVVDSGLVMSGDGVSSLVVGSSGGMGYLCVVVSINSLVVIDDVGSFGIVVSLNVMGVLVKRLLVVNDLVVVGELASVAIVVVHLEDEVSILNVDLAGHEEGGVVLEAPVVAGVPLLGVEMVEVVSPLQVEVLFLNIIVVHLNEVVLGVPGHLSVVEVVVPWRPHGSPEVHHELSGHVEEVHILGTLGLAHELVVHEPAHVVRGPLDGVSEPVAAGVEASGVVVVLSTISPDDVHGERIVGDGGHNLDIDFVPAVGPVLGRVGEEGLHSAHLVGVLHLCHELSVREPLLRAHLTREVVSLGDSNERNSASGVFLHLY